jgi:predicted O-methyltransferase YrrM
MTVRSIIHATDPYLNIQKESLPFVDHGWGGNDPIFAELIEQVKPKRILELGSWYGQSAITMGLSCKNLGLDTEIVCVDTWLGSAEHWLVPPYREMLRMKDGRPEFYHQFLANVMHAGLQDFITPFPATVSVACVVLNNRAKFDLIYVDAGHLGPEPAECLNASAPLLADGGVTFGHDIHWPDVANAVGHWSALYRTAGDFWIAGEAA